MDSNNRQAWKKLFTLEVAPFTILTILSVLNLFWISFFSSLTFPFAKFLLITLGVVLALVIFLIGTIRKGLVRVSYNPVILTFAGLALVYLISAIASPNFIRSAIGYGYETGTFFGIVLLFVLTFLVSSTFSTTKRIISANLVFIVCALILALFHICRFWFGTGFLSLGVFTDQTSNTIGKWNELSFFFGVALMLAFVALETLKLKKLHQIVLYALAALSLFILVVVSFAPIWFMVAIFAAVMFIYQIAQFGAQRRKMAVVEPGNDVPDTGETRMSAPVRRKISWRAIVVLALAIFFVTPIGQDFGRNLAARYSVNNVEVRPSWSATKDIFVGTVKSDPILGAGPNRFSAQWQLHRPDINLTNFWSFSFDSGIGFVPTSIIETGILGLLAWLASFLALLYTGWRAISKGSSDQFSRYLVLSSFLASVFLWVMSVIYTPSMAMTFLTFLFTGLFVASVASAGVYTPREYVFGKYPAMSFAAVLVSVVLIVLGLGTAYVVSARSVSSMYYQEGLLALNAEGNGPKGADLLARAASITPNDIYYRTLAELGIAQMNNVIAEVGARPQATDEEKTRFQSALELGLQSALLAQKRDPSLFENQLMLARVHEASLGAGVGDAYVKSKAAYEEALKLSPQNPGLYLSLARLEASQNNLEVAAQHMVKTLELKPNYIEAMFFQSQLDIAKGNLPAAIRSVEQVAVLTPNDPLVFFRLGLLKYDAKDYAGAVTALQKSVSLVPAYANAKYFLGLSYAAVGRRAEAIDMFEELQEANPDNEELSLILTNLRAGRQPFTNAPTADTKPEKRKTLPVDEQE